MSKDRKYGFNATVTLICALVGGRAEEGREQVPVGIMNLTSQRQQPKVLNLLNIPLSYLLRNHITLVKRHSARGLDILRPATHRIGYGNTAHGGTVQALRPALTIGPGQGSD